MADISISKFTTQIPRVGASPSTPGFSQSEGQDPVNPSGGGQNHAPVTIGSPANGLTITAGQELSLGLASSGDNGALSSTDWSTFNSKIGGTIASGQVAFGTGVNTVGGSNNLFWDNVNSRLSIGSITPSYNLQIAGNILARTASDPAFIYNFGILYHGDNYFQQYSGTNYQLRARAGYSLSLHSNNVERARFLSTGEFGLNTTSPTNTLDVNGTARIRTISNLGSTATRFLVASATGVVSERTGAELVSDLGISGGISGLTTNRIPKATSSTTIGDSIIQDLGTTNGSILIGSTTVLATATPLIVSLGGTRGTNTVGSSGNLKFKIYDDGTSANDSGIGVSTNLMEIRAGSGASIGLFVNNGVERFRISSSGEITASEKLTITGGSSGSQNPLIVTSGGTDCRIQINHPSNSGFGLFINSVRKWSVASYNTNSDFTIYNDARVKIGMYAHGLTNNFVFCDQNTTPSDNGYRLEVIGTFRTTGNILIGSTTSLLTTTPLSISTGGTYGNSTAGSANNLKFYLYQDSTPANSYGIGMTAGLMELRAGTGAAIGFFPNNGVEALRILSTGNLQFADAKNIVFNTTTGTKIGTATSQKLGFWNATPIVQPTTAVTGATLVGGGGTTITDTDTFDGYTLAQIVKALRNTGLLA